MSDISVEKELSEATKVRRKKKESDNSFKLRLLSESDNLSDEEFEELSEASQNWIEAAIDAVNDSDSEDEEDINFPPFPEESRAERENDPDVLDSPDSGKRIRQRRKPVMERKPKGGVQWEMTRMVWQNENITWLALKNEMNKLGYEPSDSMCKQFLSRVRQTIKMGRMLGRVVDE